ncbi:MAG: hypothetical protein ACREOE_18920 [Gemmatimonadales bacterium]
MAGPNEAAAAAGDINDTEPRPLLRIPTAPLLRIPAARFAAAAAIPAEVPAQAEPSAPDRQLARAMAQSCEQRPGGDHRKAQRAIFRPLDEAGSVFGTRPCATAQWP